MQVETTSPEGVALEGVLILTPRRHGDARVFFAETWNRARLKEAAGIDPEFVQDNHSLSARAGTLRGLHFQAPPHAHGKLVRCVRGALWDVVVDIRVGSPTYGQHLGVELSADNGRQLWVPEGFAHGFVTLRDDTEIVYKCTDYYAPAADGAVRWDSCGIKWPLTGDPVLSDKDAMAPTLAEFQSPFGAPVTSPDRLTMKSSPKLFARPMVQLRRIGGWRPLWAGLALGLAALVYAFRPVLADPGRLEELARLTWPASVAQGISGLEIADDGARFVAVSDRGWRYEGRIGRTGDGTLVSVALEHLTALPGHDGLPASARRVSDWSDAEGLAVGRDGTEWVSFERWARVERQPRDPSNASVFLRGHPDFADWCDNRQLEALAISDTGDLYALPEQAGRHGFPLYRLARAHADRLEPVSAWERLGDLPAGGWVLLDRRFSTGLWFAPVGADFGPDGALYILERRLIFGMMWQARIRRLVDTDALGAVETLWTGAAGSTYNLEGLAVWQAEDGLRLLAVSDSNGDRDEPTQFIEFRLKEDDYPRKS